MTATTTEKAEKKQKSYFVTETVNRFYLDDKESFIEHKPLDEGLFQVFQDLTSRIKLDREGESTEVDMAIGRQRRFLLENLVTGWNLVDENNKAIAYTPQKLQLLEPAIIQKLVADIYEKNDILRGDFGDEEAKKA